MFFHRMLGLGFKSVIDGPLEVRLLISVYYKWYVGCAAI